MAARIPKSLDDLVRQRAGHRCEYCRSAERLTGQRCQIDHILPISRGGQTESDNLGLACVACNGHKLDRTEADDPETGTTTALFNPRTQVWREHFAWSEDGLQIVGLTPCGRATIVVLRLNRPLIVAARGAWVSLNRHPPED